MKKPVIILVVIAILGIALSVVYWLSTHAYLDIVVDNSGNNSLTYTIQSDSNNTISVSTSSSEVKKLVARGNYEVSVTQASTSYFAFTSTGGYLQSTTVKTHLQPEKARSFVGNNPGTCMFYNGQTLFSYTCQGLYNQAYVHVAATASQPTYTQRLPWTTPPATIEGMVQTTQGSLVLVHYLADDSGKNTNHFLYTLQANGRVAGGKQLTELDPAKSYAIQSYKTGFVVYDTPQFSQLLYYTSADAIPSPVKIDKPSGFATTPDAISIADDSVAAIYPSQQASDEANTNSGSSSSKTTTEVIISQNGSSKEISFPQQYAGITLCGTGKLCVLAAKSLGVYDITGSKPVLLYSLGNVLAMNNIESTLYVVTDKNILNLNVDQQDGFSDYSFGDYIYCGIQSDTTGYTLCLTNSKQEKVALHIDKQAVNKDDIDKKISALLKLGQISDISAYGPYIFISPKLGDLVYNNTTQSFGYDSAVQRSVNSQISNAVSQQGINQTLYRIINTSSP